MTAKLHVVGTPDLAAMLRARRALTGVTQADVAEFIGVRTQTIGAWERGDHPQTRFDSKIAEFLGLGDKADVRHLLRGELPPSTQSKALASQEFPTQDNNDSIDTWADIMLNVSRRMSHGSLTEAEVEILRELLRRAR